MKYAKPRREHATQFPLGCSPPKLLDRSSPKFYLHDIVALFNHAHRRRYPITFLNHQALHFRRSGIQSECQSDESAELAIFITKSVAVAMSLEISKKQVEIDHQHPKHFHSVKRLRKSV